MKNLIFLFACVSILSCSSQKTTPGQTTSSTADSVDEKANNETKAATPTKTIILNNTEPVEKPKTDKDPTTVKNTSQTKADKLPACIQELVNTFLKEDVQNPPRKIYSYTYNGKMVYYVTPPCCDFFSDLYDAQCKLIAHPDGGITGRGDGRAKDFNQNKSQEKLLWEDVRR